VSSAATTDRGGLLRARRLLPPLWAGLLLCMALVATPAPFATLERDQAGLVVAFMFKREAFLTLAAALAFVLIERRRARAGQGRQFSVEMALALGALFCTVAGYFGLQPMMAGARAGQGTLSFGQLHAVSLVFFGLKILCVLVLSWRVAAPGRAPDF
jgi:hypothetical protein